jgi:hypothetical protein
MPWRHVGERSFGFTDSSFRHWMGWAFVFTPRPR